MSNPMQLGGNLLGAESFKSAAMMSRIDGAADIDALGHVNNAVYLVWAQEAAVAHWLSIADGDLLKKYIWVALRHEIDYRDQIFAGETVEVRTWLGAASGPRYERHVDIRKPRAKRPAAKVLTVWCLIDAKTRKPRRVGPDVFKPFGLEG